MNHLMPLSFARICSVADVDLTRDDNGTIVAMANDRKGQRSDVKLEAGITFLKTLVIMSLVILATSKDCA